MPARQDSQDCWIQCPDTAAGHCPPTPLPETPGHPQQVWLSLLWGHCSFLLGPSAHKLFFVPLKSLFPQCCVSSGGSKVGLMTTSSKRAYATPRFTASRAPALVAVHFRPVPPQETLKRSSASVSVGSLGPGEHKGSIIRLLTLYSLFKI